MAVFIFILLSLAACRSDQPAERYGFVATLGRDTVSVESVTRRGNVITSDVVDRFPRVRQRHTRIVLGGDGGIELLVMDIHTPSETENKRDRHVEADVIRDEVRISKRDAERSLDAHICGVRACECAPSASFAR